MADMHDIKAHQKLAELEKLVRSPGFEKGGGGPYDGDMEHRVTALETRLDTILPTLANKTDVAEVRADVSKATAETHKGFSDMVKWIVGTGFVGLAAMITIMTFVLNNATPKQQQASTQPVIINVPGVSTTPAAVSPTTPQPQIQIQPAK